MRPAGPITYTVTYADANFNSSTLSPSNITLNETGTANGTLSVSGSGLTCTVTISSITGNGSLGISIAAGTASDLAGNLAPAAGPSATFTVDNTAPTISIGAPSAAYAAGGPVTYTVTYADANFNSSTLATSNITLNETGTANGTVERLRLGPDLHGDHQQHYGQRHAGDFDRRRHGLGPGRQPGPGRRAQRDLHRRQHRPHDLDRCALGSLCSRRARHLHGDLRRCELQFQHPGHRRTLP